ncbi:hypothetical protein [Clostridium tyrobutyricum]|uniref:hypothetical protein n=1 Tax=Clostridium tyrobutyricum TaxID=1519 RepID=UPI00311AA340
MTLNLNTYIYSLFNNVYNNFNFKTRQSELIQSINNSVKKTLNAQYSFGDSVSIESSRQVIENQKHLASLTEIQGKSIKSLYANDNVLDLDTNSYYKVQTSSGTTALFKVSNSGNIYMPYQELGLDENITLPRSDYEEISKVSSMISELAKDKTAFAINTSTYSSSEIKDTLAKVGLKPGFIQIKNGSNSNKFYLTNSGLIYPEYQVEAERQAWAERNWFEDGFTKDSKFILEGKEYRLDQDGHLNIPSGTASVSDNLKMIK